VGKHLGKIESATLRIEEWRFEFIFTLKFGGYGCVDGKRWIHVDAATEHCKWKEEDRRKAAAEHLIDVCELMKTAKVREFSDLVGVPIEVIMEDGVLKSWRVLEEVL
jgi:hypothetical protein